MPLRIVFSCKDCVILSNKICYDELLKCCRKVAGRQNFSRLDSQKAKVYCIQVLGVVIHLPCTWPKLLNSRVENKASFKAIIATIKPKDNDLVEKAYQLPFCLRIWVEKVGKMYLTDTLYIVFYVLFYTFLSVVSLYVQSEVVETGIG